MHDYSNGIFGNAYIKNPQNSLARTSGLQHKQMG